MENVEKLTGRNITLPDARSKQKESLASRSIKDVACATASAPSTPNKKSKISPVETAPEPVIISLNSSQETGHNESYSTGMSCFLPEYFVDDDDE